MTDRDYGGPCTKLDLAHSYVLFGVTAEPQFGNSGVGTILLDNIQYLPVPANQPSVTSLPVSARTYGSLPQLNYPIPTDQVNRNLASIYEAALAILAFFSRGQLQDNTNAVNVASALAYALHNDNVGDAVPTAGGYSGLHSGYESGDLAFKNAQPTQIGLGQSGNTRLSGFSASANLCGPSAYCLLLDGSTGGNNAWAMLALAEAYVHTGNTTFLNDAEAIGNWIAAAFADTSGTGYGGYFLGYSDGGSPQQLLLGKSTEQNADIFAAMNLLSQIETMRGNTAAAATWAGRAKVAGDFVLKMYDSMGGRFNTGTVNNLYVSGPGSGICPSATQSQGTDTVNTCDFLDANTAPILAMSGSTVYKDAINWTLPVQYLSNFAQTAVAAAGNNYSGYGLLNTAVAAAGVAWEFTAQAAAALQTVPSGAAAAANATQQILNAMNTAPFGDGRGVPASTLPSGDTVAPANQCLDTPFQCVPERPGLAASSWAAMAALGVNPMSPTLFAASISAKALNLGSAVVGSSTPPQTITITNTGSATLVLSVSLAGGSPGDFSLGSCPGSFASGASCAITVGFHPSATGSRTATLAVTATPSWATQSTTTSVALAGTGTQQQPCLDPCACLGQCPATGTLTLSPAALAVSAPQGAPAPPQSVSPLLTVSKPGNYSISLTIPPSCPWLGLTSGSLSQGANSGAMYTYSGTIAAIVTASDLPVGSYSCNASATVAGVVGSTANLVVNLNIVTPPPLSASPRAVSLTCVIGDPDPAPVPITVFSDPAGSPFRAAVSSTGGWLSIKSVDLATPGFVVLAISCSKLAPGANSGTLTLTNLAGKQFPVPVDVRATTSSSTISLPPGQVVVLERNGATASRPIPVVYGGSGTLAYSASVTTPVPWIQLATGAGNATHSVPGQIGYSINAAGLAPGAYQTSVAVSSTAGNAATTILLLVSSGPQITPSQTGLAFRAAAGGPAPPPQSFLVSTASSLAWSLAASTNPNPGGSAARWLSASGGGGVIPGSSNTARVSVDPTGLPAGQYLGLVTINSPGAANAPLGVSVQLTVDPAGSAPIQVSTSGLMFARGATDQTISVFNPSSSPANYSMSIYPPANPAWLTAAPPGGTLAPGNNSIAFHADPTIAGAGISTAQVRLGFSDGTSSAIQAVLVAGGAAVPNAQPAACANNQPSYVVGTLLAPAADATITTASPQPVRALLVDDCGSPVTAKTGSAQVSFSNGDLPVTLADAGNGVWEGSWVPANPQTPTALSITVGSTAVTGASTISVSVLTATAGTRPSVAGVVNAAAGAKAVPQVVAPGSYVAIYGSNLSGTTVSPGTTPLPTTLGGVQASIGGLRMPLIFASPGQINGLVPLMTPVNSTQQLVVQVGPAASVPVTLAVTSTQPGIYTVNTSGSGQGIVQIANTVLLAGPPAPGYRRAAHGESLVAYCAGLGVVVGQKGGEPPPDGAATPPTDLFSPVAAVTASLGGQAAPAAAYLTPGFVGLYQVNIKIPDNAPSGDAVTLTVATTDPQSGAASTSNTVTVAIQ